MGLRGPKPWEPTEQEIAKIRMLAGLGATQEMIATLIGKSVDVLHKNDKTREAMSLGKAEVLAKVAGVLVQKALAGDAASVFFYLKTQGRWREVHSHEHSGPNGSPIPIDQRISLKDAPPETLAYLAGKALPEE